MTHERLTMRKIQEVLRLKWACGLSNRAIARSCSISHSTVKEYLERAKSAGVNWPLPEQLTEEELFKQLFPEKAQAEALPKAMPDWQQVHAELRKQSVTLKLLWSEYKEANPNGFQYSQYCDRYRQWACKLNPTMRMVHKAGEKLFVDYAGDTVPIVNPETGEITRFADDKHYASYCRLAPGARDSGGKHKHRSGSKDGNQYLKYAFTEAAIKAMQFYPEIKQFALRLEERSNASIARTVVAKKLSKIAYFVLRRHQQFLTFKGIEVRKARDWPRTCKPARITGVPLAVGASPPA